LPTVHAERQSARAAVLSVASPICPDVVATVQRRSGHIPSAARPESLVVSVSGREQLLPIGVERKPAGSCSASPHEIGNKVFNPHLEVRGIQAGSVSGQPRPARQRPSGHGAHRGGAGRHRSTDHATRRVLERRFSREALPLHGELLRIARRYTLNHHDAEDLVQDTFVRAWLGYDSCTPGCNVRAWMKRIMVNIWIDDYRKSQRRPKVVLTAFDADASCSIERQPGSAAASAEDVALDLLPNEVLLQAIRSLPAALQSVLFYADVCRLPMRTIAEMEAVPVGTVGSRLHRARRQLRSVLLEEEAPPHGGRTARRGHRRVPHGCDP
jgi:RNA polymerase sigma-70 factor (ECF subfamily)